MKHESVQEYYGKVLTKSADLQTNACCTPADIPAALKPILAKIHDKVSAKYYGCGLLAPNELKGAKILDLGSGSGRDVYVLSALVGENGFVDGVDMTDEQLAVAQSYKDYHAEIFGFETPNTAFHKGYIEKLDEVGLAAGSYDIIVSNCVVNLATDKSAVLKSAWDLLKPGGEMYFSDVYASRRIPEALAEDEVLYGECLSGALYWNDFLRLAKNAGFADPRLVEDRPLTIDNPALEDKLGEIEFFSATYRLFKLDGLEPSCEDYGQAVRYKGTIEGASDVFLLDKHHQIETGKIFPVCGNTWKMLIETRFAQHFEFFGDFSNHFGIFEGCGEAVPFDGQDAVSDTAASCC